MRSDAPRSEIRHLIAADVGNSAIKLGRFPWPLPPAGAEPATGRWEADSDLADLAHWLPAQAAEWCVASVRPEVAQMLAAWVARHRPQDALHALGVERLPLALDVAHPQRVGLDRLLAAVAAVEWKQSGRAVVVIDAGTAVTVDLVTADDVFRGGAILPGLRMAAAALAGQTAQLPLVETQLASPGPAAVGRDTPAAIRSGLVWGIVGAVRELVARFGQHLDHSPDVIVTGGDGAGLVRLLSVSAHYDPHLVLRGIAATRRSQIPSSDESRPGQTA
jgi:type III pantothenate kinase